jgi:hypothetical protein
MAAAETIRRRHSPDDGIQWLQVKLWMCSIGQCASRRASYRRISMAIEINSNLPAFFVVANLLLPTNISK